MLCAPTARPAATTDAPATSPSRFAPNWLAMMTSATTAITTVATFSSTLPSVRVRWITRAVCRGDAMRACVSSTFCRRFTPLTMRSTRFRMTRRRNSRRTTARTTTITIVIAVCQVSTNCVKAFVTMVFASSVGDGVDVAARSMVRAMVGDGPRPDVQLRPAEARSHGVLRGPEACHEDDTRERVPGAGGVPEEGGGGSRHPSFDQASAAWTASARSTPARFSTTRRRSAGVSGWVSSHACVASRSSTLASGAG